MRFALIDKITELEAGKSITAIKNLSLAEEYLADHFPGFAVMPGVLMLEAMVQASAWLMRYTDDFKYSAILLKQARAVRFNSFVVPGQTLCVTATIQKRGPRECVLKAAGTVDGASTVNARLTLEQFNLSETEPNLAESDSMRIQSQREMFAQLWSEATAANGAVAEAK
jgi:3-hydroxyacyl-[acyl-carrier-protein] dehydratase